jgi:hypothetical protein
MKSPEYFQYLCDSFVGWFLPRFRTAVFDCKKFSEIGAEQLSSDVGQIKRVLEELPVVGRPNDVASEVFVPLPNASRALPSSDFCICLRYSLDT